MRPRRLVRFTFRGLVLLLCIILAESLSAVVLRTMNGTWVTRSELLERIGRPAEPLSSSPTDDPFEHSSANGNGSGDDGKAVAAKVQAPRWMLHPYLGFTRNPEADFHLLNRVRINVPVNEYGFFGPSPVTTRSDDTFTVVLTGGSVALELYLYSRETLLAELSGLPQAQGKKVELVCTALGGMKQPQQLIALNYFLSLGADYDMVLNLDGFNEVVLPVAENLTHSVNPYFPRNWVAYGAMNVDQAAAVIYGQLAERSAERQRWGEWVTTSPLRWSYFGLALWQSKHDRLGAEILALEQALREHMKDDHLGPQQRGPAYRRGTRLEVAGDLVELWRNAGLLMWRLSRASGISYYQFLQPNQYVNDSKPFTDWERKYAIKPQAEYAKIARVSYPALIEAARELGVSDAPVYDLTGIYEDVDDHVYKDSCCHLGQLGGDLLAKAMVERIAAASP